MDFSKFGQVGVRQISASLKNAEMKPNYACSVIVYAKQCLPKPLTHNSAWSWRAL